MTKSKGAPAISEAELCAAFIDWVAKHGFVAYPETAGWDILLVDADGMQVGVQAKLRFNAKVVSQALPDYWDWGGESTGPDFRTVLVPERDWEAHVLCGYLGLGLFYAEERRYGYLRELKREPLGCFSPDVLRLSPHDRGFMNSWHYWNPERRHALPAYVPDVAAGASGPTQLTKWKIAALRICVKEVPLPSGAFANVRKPLGADVAALRKLRADRAKEGLPERDVVFELLTLVAKIDDAPVTYEQLDRMEVPDLVQLELLVAPYLIGAQL